MSNTYTYLGEPAFTFVSLCHLVFVINKNKAQLQLPSVKPTCILVWSLLIWKTCNEVGWLKQYCRNKSYNAQWSKDLYIKVITRTGNDMNNSFDILLITKLSVSHGCNMSFKQGKPLCYHRSYCSTLCCLPLTVSFNSTIDLLFDIVLLDCRRPFKRHILWQDTNQRRNK